MTCVFSSCCLIDVQQFKSIIQYINSSTIISKYFKSIPAESLNMKIMILKKNQPITDMKYIKKCLTTAFSYIDYFDMQLDSTYLFPDSTIGIKLLLTDNTIYNILKNIRGDIINKLQISQEEVILHITLAKCFKKVERYDLEAFQKEFLKISDLVGKIQTITLGKPDIYFSDDDIHINKYVLS